MWILSFGVLKTNLNLYSTSQKTYTILCFCYFFPSLSVTYFLCKMNSLLQTNSRSSQVSLLTRKAQFRFTANRRFGVQLRIFFDFNLLHFVLIASLAMSLLFCDSHDISLEALPFLTFCSKIQMTTLLTLPWVLSFPKSQTNRVECTQSIQIKNLE